MNKTKSILYILIFALTAALIVSFPLNQAKAYTCPGLDTDIICAAGGLANCDSDLDGYTDAEECAGITLPNENNTGDLTYNMDPTKQDLFLILVTAIDVNDNCSGEASLLPADLLYPSTNPQSLSGLGLTVHVIKNSQVTDQAVGVYQKAVTMIESCSTANPNVAGSAEPGLPTFGIDGKVFTYVIKNKIESACAGKTCYEGLEDGTKVERTAAELIEKHIVNTFNHETGHMLGLSINVDRKIGNHWKVGTGAELDQFVNCTTKGSSTTCYIPDVHPLPDIAGFRLK